MVMLNVVYFHGYGSSANTPKVRVLRNSLNVPVFAFDANTDPEIAIKEVGFNIDMLLMEDLHAPIQTIFVGTSLGGWLASEMGAKYGIPVIAINPSFDPKNSLKKYDLAEGILNKYTAIKLSKKNVYFFAEHDSVIDNTVFRQELIDQGYEVYIDSDADHQYLGKSFDKVIEYIKKSYMVLPNSI